MPRLSWLGLAARTLSQRPGQGPDRAAGARLSRACGWIGRGSGEPAAGIWVGVRRMGPDSFQQCPVTGQGAMGTN